MLQNLMITNMQMGNTWTNKDVYFRLVILPGEGGLDSRRIVGYFFHSSSINNADRQAFSGFWFAISKGRRKCAAYSPDRVVELSFHEMSKDVSVFFLFIYFLRWHTILYV